jgi:hypothetical protein
VPARLAPEGQHAEDPLLRQKWHRQDRAVAEPEDNRPDLDPSTAPALDLQLCSGRHARSGRSVAEGLREVALSQADRTRKDHVLRLDKPAQAEKLADAGPIVPDGVSQVMASGGTSSSKPAVTSRCWRPRELCSPQREP